LTRVLDQCLRMLHPFTPFITEELWGHLRSTVLTHFGESNRYPAGQASLDADWPEALIIAPWPQAKAEEGWELDKVSDFNLLQESIRAIRNLRAEKNVPPSRRLPATILAGDRLSLLRDHIKTLAFLAGLNPQAIHLVENLASKPEGQVALVVSGLEIYLPLEGMVNQEEERARLTKELAEIESQVARLSNLLASPFAEKAPAAVVQKERERLAGFEESANKIKGQISEMG
jgi:valyl-tRNA synthetase